MVRPILTFALALIIACPALAQVPPFVISWGSYGTGDGEFYTPVGVAVDSDGIVYVVDSNLNKLKRFTRAGAFISQWSVNRPLGVAVGADGYVYVTRHSSRLIAKYTESGTLIAEWDGGDDGLTSLAVDADGSLWVSSGYGAVRRYSSSGTLLAEWSDGAVPGFPSLESLDGVAVDGRGHFYTVQNANPDREDVGLVRKFTTTGTLLTQWAVPSVCCGNPVRLAISPDGSMVYVVDHPNHRIQVFTDTGGFLGEWGTVGTGPGQFLNPIGIAVDGLGNVFVADTNNSRIQVFGDRTTSAVAVSWAALKRRYR